VNGDMIEMSSKHLVLEELQRTFDKKYLASDILDGKLQTMLNFLSVIVAVVPAIAGSTLFDKIGFLFWIPIILVLVLYWNSFRKIMYGLRPSEYYQPISNNWDELDKRYFNLSEDETLNLIISEHLTASERAEKQNIRKEKAVLEVSNLMGWIVVLLLLSVPIGLIPSPTLPCLLHLSSCVAGAKP
jgi:hypothetical protein